MSWDLDVLDAWMSGCFLFWIIVLLDVGMFRCSHVLDIRVFECLDV